MASNTGYRSLDLSGEILKKTQKEHSEPDCYKTVPKKETIFYIFINLMGNIQEYNVGKI